jgi:ABC-2 type transport system permease protein
MNAVTTLPAATPRPGLLRSPFAWLVRREIWETKAVWIAPAICAGILLLLVTAVGIRVGDFRVAVLDADFVDKLRGFPPEQIRRLGAGFLFALAVPFFVTLVFTQFFYAVDALYTDRRDRSVLFWKSLPVSDAQTVLSKVFTTCVTLPLVTGAAAILTQGIVWLLLAIKLAGKDLPVADALLPTSTWLPAAGVVLYTTFALMLWSVPLVGWLLAVSALAPRSPFLFATLPPVAVMIVERLVFGTDHVAAWVRERIAGHFTGTLAAIDGDGSFVLKLGDGAPVVSPVAYLIRPLELLSSPSVWLGVLIGGLLIAVAIWARRYRDEST